MAKTREIVLTVALMASLWTVGMGQSSSSCTNVLISMAPCLNYITGNSSTPSAGCCTQLASVVSSQPKCLCEVINGNAAASLGLNINRTVALELPSACSIQTPPISRCNNGGSSPSGSPSSNSSPGTSTTPSESTGSKSGDTSKGPTTIEGPAVFLFLAPAWVLWTAM